MNKIYSTRTNEKIKSNEQLLVGYLLAGYPSKEDFLYALKCSVEAGLDIVEIGFPSSNPVNDGKVIKDANRKADMSIWDDPDFWKEVRKTVNVPIWIMGYNEELLDTPRYLELAKSGIADGFVLPGISPEVRRQLSVELAEYECDVLGFVNPHTPLDEARDCFSSCSLVYMQLYVGQTGSKAKEDEFEPMLNIAKQYSGVSIFAGFGIDTKERATHLWEKGFDGVIVGTAMIKKQNESVEVLKEYIQELKSGANKVQKL